MHPGHHEEQGTGGQQRVVRLGVRGEKGKRKALHGLAAAACMHLSCRVNQKQSQQSLLSQYVHKLKETLAILVTQLIASWQRPITGTVTAPHRQATLALYLSSCHKPQVMHQASVTSNATCMSQVLQVSQREQDQSSRKTKQTSL